MPDDRSRENAGPQQSRSSAPDKRADKLGRRDTDHAPPNEGEGNKTAARDYNARTERFVKSGRVEEKAREAKEAVDSDEREELAEAEAVGKSHSAGDDPPRKKKR